MADLMRIIFNSKTSLRRLGKQCSSHMDNFYSIFSVLDSSQTFHPHFHVDFAISHKNAGWKHQDVNEK